MAKLYFVKDGPRPDNSGQGREILASNILKKFKSIRWLGVNSPVFEKDNPSKAPKHVVFEIGEEETCQPIITKAGFYFLKDVSPELAYKELNSFFR